MSDSISSRKSSPHWKAIGALGGAAWLVAGPLAGCGGEEGAATSPAGSEDAAALAQPLVEGAGAGGKSEGAAAAGADLTAADVGYLTQLGLIRGHLAVGYALYQRELPQLAETHMKHPREEIYASVVPAFNARGCAGFANDLESLAAAVKARAAQEEVAAIHAELAANITRCEQSASADDPAVLAKVIENLLRTAAAEYRIGVIDGVINNLHEYQDAWGFTQVASAWARSAAFADGAGAAAVAAQLQDIIVELDGLWPSLDPEGRIDGDAARLFGAAARVQIAALPLRN